MAYHAEMTLEDFLQNNRIEQDTWKKADIAWDCLREIAADHEAQHHALRDSAELFARVIQRCSAVHSVRLRIKDTEHLLSKIVRKRADEQTKYKEINASNYFEIVTDLIGIRALHLFKEDCFEIDSHLQKNWKPHEDPVAYCREGDPPEFLDKFTDAGFKVEEHSAGYRSVHYILKTQPMQRTVFAEVQVRTIFEEGWSEIDHRVRYPNYSDDRLVSYFLTIFNRLAGSADEMGTFVQELNQAMDKSRAELAAATIAKEEALQRVETIVSELDSTKEQDANTRSQLASLQRELKKLKVAYATGGPTASANVDRLHFVPPDAFLTPLGEKAGAFPNAAIQAIVNDSARVVISKEDQKRFAALNALTVKIPKGPSQPDSQ